MFKRFSLGLIIIILGAPVLAQEIIPKIDFMDAAVIDVVQVLAKQADLDIVISGDSSLLQNKKITLHLKNISAEEAIEYALKSSGLSFEKRNSAILVSTLPLDQNQTAYPAELEAVSLKYLSAERVSALLGKTMPGLIVSAGSRANSLVLQGKRSQIEEVKSLIYSIDQPVPQILIESKVLEISESGSIHLGLNYNNGAFTFLTNKDSRKSALASDLVITLNSLIGSGQANLVASPRLATLDNQEATINIGTRVPYAVPVRDSGGISTSKWAVEYIDAGVKLKILPRVGEEGFMTVDLQPEVSSISEWRTTPAGEFPVIATRNAQSTIKVKNGETIIIAGLLSEENRENISRVPILGQIPGLHLLFQNRTVEKVKTEIIFLITPRLI